MKSSLLSLVFALAMVFAFQTTYGQGTTTSSINGRVIGVDGSTLPGATVIALHEPSGSSYGTITREDGTFNLPNLRTGGPYKVTVTYVGFRAEEILDIRLGLGEERTLNFVLLDDQMELQEVVVVGAFDQTFNPGRTGATTNVDNQTIERMPTISRNINDFTRLSPQSNGSSFAGRDNRFNNYTIDGNIYNNNFGLGTAQFAAGNPISIDAIEEIQVNIAPYDVRQGGFTGANVNAITKSGTNQFTGSAYAYLNNEYMQGVKIGEDWRTSAAEAFTKIRGASLGGPIIKDRLFFFVSVEQEEASNPGDTRLASRDGLAPDGQTVSRVPAERMEFVRKNMQSIYNYETGGYENYDFGNEALRLNFRLDFNINPYHRLALRVNHYEAFRDVTINGNSVRNVPRYRYTNRYGIEALTFRNANYSVDNNVTSVVAELNSVFGNRFSNSLNIGYTAIEDPIRSVPGGQTFPFIEVMEDIGEQPYYYFALGNELYTVGNLLSNNIFNVTNNFNYYLGSHTLTAGVNLELMTFENAFNPNFHTFYRFYSYDDFVKAIIDKDPSVRPGAFAMSYSYEGGTAPPVDETRFGQFGIYVQDKYQVNDNLSVTAGLRVDMPFFPIDLPSNPKLDEMVADGLTFTNPRDGSEIKPDVSVLPGLKPLISPRLSFNWDAFGDNTLQVRGGTGFFSGRIPFVWISNQVNANGVTRGLDGWTADQWGVDGRPAWEGFQTDPNYYKPSPEELEADLSRDINLTDTEFKFPQVWRTNIAADYRLPHGIIGTLEGIYSKDYNSPLAVNVNLAEPEGTFSGVDQRPYWTSYADNPDFNEVMLLTNINEGHYASITAQLQKDFENGLYASIAYTRSVSKDYGLIGGSQAASLWPVDVAEDRNNPEIGYSRFDQPNRVVGYVSFNSEMLSAKNTTTFALFYVGGEAGRFSYRYAGNFGDRAGRLMYIPRDKSEINLLPIISGEEVVLTPDEQWEKLNNFIEQDEYLSENRGSIAERNGAKLPWLHRFDLRIAQDLLLTSDPNRHKFQFTVDILNFGNMLNSEWGITKQPVQNTPLSYAGRDEATNEPTYRLNTITGTSDYPENESYRDYLHLSQTWRMQVGIRYIF